MTLKRGDWRRKLTGRFIVFDGPDGSGKSTQFRRFSADLEKLGLEVCEVREPGGTYIGEQIRRVLLDPANQEEVDLRCEMLLFMASRAQLVAQRIRPALGSGALVLADRFISSTLAYQGSAGGIPLDDIRRVGQVALGECWPDLVIIFDVDEQTAATRLKPLLDRMELKDADYHRTVRRGYLQQAADDPQRYLVVDANADVETVYHRMWLALEGHAQGWSQNRAAGKS
jgi:dTMP kinase